MPSDPSGVQPRGVLSKPAPDWFDDNMAVGMFTIHPATPQVNSWYAAALFNNGNQGMVFKVYAVSLDLETGLGAYIQFVKGAYGTLQSNCQALRPDISPSFGQMFGHITLSNTVIPDDRGLNAPIANIGSSGFDCSFQSTAFPLFIVPPGWSLVVYPSSLTGTDEFSCTIWYQQANE